MERAFPYALAMGMTYEEYWKCSPYLYSYYKEADEIKLMRDNYMLWLQGIYNLNAFRNVAESVVNAIGNGNHKPEPYMEYPIAITKIEQEEEHKRNVEKTLRFFREGQKV